MKIALTTIQNSSNYGAMLQVFALQTYLTLCGHDVEVVNYDNRFMSKGLDKIRHGLNLRECYYTLLDLVNYSERMKMINKFKCFSHDNLKLGPLLSKKEILTEYGKTFDAYVSGSDQIWNPNITNGIVDEVYFCGMAPKNALVISYASSIGGYQFNDEQKNLLIKKNLQKYSKISTREENYINQLTELSGKEITKVMDPVFLLSADEWKSKLSVKKEKCSPYILIYAMSKHEAIIKKVMEEFKNLNYEVRIIYPPMFKKKGIKYVIDAGPKEFVELFFNASFVVTNSFHGTALSMIFNKKFCVMDNANNMNRLYDLVKSVGAERVIRKMDEPINDICIDYEKINKKLLKLIFESKEFLNGGLKLD